MSKPVATIKVESVGTRHIYSINGHTLKIKNAKNTNIMSSPREQLEYLTGALYHLNFKVEASLVEDRNVVESWVVG